jgi:hypothetical protein
MYDYPSFSPAFGRRTFDQPLGFECWGFGTGSSDGWAICQGKGRYTVGNKKMEDGAAAVVGDFFGYSATAQLAGMWDVEAVFVCFCSFWLARAC